MALNAGELNSGGFVRDADGRLVTVQSGGSSAAVTTDVTKVGGTAVDANSGSKSAGTLRVVIATDQPALTNALLVDVTRPSTATVTQVASSATSVTLQASNASRKGLVIHNDSTQLLYVKFGTTASTTSYTYQVPSQSALELPAPAYTGRVDGIWAAANGNAYVTEAV